MARHKQVDQGHNTTQHHTHRCGDTRTLNTHAHGKDEYPVEDGVQHRGDDVTPHGIARRTIQAYDKEAYKAEHLEHKARHEPQRVVHDIGHKRGRSTQQLECLARKGEDKGAYNGCRERRGYEGLRDIQARHLELLLGQMYACHDRAARTHHKCYARHKRIYGYDDIDRSDTHSAHTMAHDDAINGGHCRHRQRAEQRGNEHLAEEFTYLVTLEIYSITLHNRLFCRYLPKNIYDYVCKDRENQIKCVTL